MNKLYTLEELRLEVDRRSRLMQFLTSLGIALNISMLIVVYYATLIEIQNIVRVLVLFTIFIIMPLYAYSLKKLYKG